MQSTTNTNTQHQAIATAYREQHGKTSGVVIVSQNEEVAWVNELRDPQSWVPGVIAVSENGTCYVATGGNAYDGATSWERIGTADAESITPPLPGQYWADQGGIYLGIIRDREQHFHLLMATTAFEGEWGEYGNLIEGEFSRIDGAHNTQLILAADPENALCVAIKNHEADGHRDFHLPAEFENNLICINARDHIEKVFHWTSTQNDAYSAWTQDFEDGFQLISTKDNSRAARAVRRLPI